MTSEKLIILNSWENVSVTFLLLEQANIFKLGSQKATIFHCQVLFLLKYFFEEYKSRKQKYLRTSKELFRQFTKIFYFKEENLSIVLFHGNSCS